MDKIDILGYDCDQSTPKNLQCHKVDEKSESLKPVKSGIEFASFIRDQTKTNMHLNLYSRKPVSGDNDYYKMYSTVKFEKLTKEEISTILANALIRKTDNFIVINKPRGISVQSACGKLISIEEVLNELSKRLMFKEPLKIVHRLDKDTTGILLLARNPESAHLLKEAFIKNQIRKNYLCLTHGIPYQESGIIDFKLKEKSVGNNTIIRPDMKSIKHVIKKKTKESTNSTQTAYKVLCNNYNISLVQCAMMSGVKHQIRAHLAYGLETPILGDHKYSWLIKENKFPILPQELSSQALAGLNLSKSKVRYLPIHLHSFQLIIGEPPLPSSRFDGKADLKPSNCPDYSCRLPNFQAFANLPNFFIKTLQSLKLYDPNIFKFVIKQIL